MRIWNAFPGVAEAVGETHEKVKLFGHHNIYHALAVGEVGRLIFLDEWGNEPADVCLSNYTGLAGMCHNADHVIFARTGENIHKEDPSHKAISSLVYSWLSSAPLNNDEKEEILNAVLNHTAPNKPEDSRILIALKDADRVVNFWADVIARSGQSYHDVPVMDHVHFLSDPKATFRLPGSVLKDLANCFDWINPATPFCVRTRLALEMATEHAGYLQDYLDRVKANYEKIGLFPDPFQRLQ